MGLDIRAYRKLSPSPDSWWKRDEDGYIDIVKEHWNDAVRLSPNAAYPDHALGVPEAVVHEYEGRMGFRAGSYGGYGHWREWLAKLAGYPKYTDSPTELLPHALSVWNGAQGPFSELINFSDCEGVIGPIFAKKLLKDFKDFEDRAKATIVNQDTYEFDLYLKWKEAFEYAADDGAVQFA